MDAIESEIVRVLGDEFGGNPQPTDELMGLGVDSLRMADLATELERRFGIKIDQDLFEVETIRDLAEYVRDRSPGGAATR